MTLESLLSAAPPGQLDGLVKDLSSLTSVSPEIVDKVKQSCTVSPEVCSHALAEPLAKEFKAHQEAYYANVDYTLSIQQKSESQLLLTTYAERIDAKNCHAGSWKGVWIIDVTSDSATLNGSIHIHAYCHEDSNVQMETTKPYENVTVQQGSNLAKSIKNKIATMESDVSAELEEMYDSMDEKLKALRRVLPIMRTRLEWNVLAHRMVKKLEETAASNQ